MAAGAPTVRLELDGMRERVIHVLHERHGEIERQVAAAIDETFAQLDLAGDVRRILTNLVQELHAALEREVRRALASEDARELMGRIVRPVLAAAFTETPDRPRRR